jgi:hypothetical protein
LKKLIEKFEAIHQRVEEKIATDYEKRPNKDDPNKK